MPLQKLEVCHGVSWVESSDDDLRVLCGCPADAVKHLMRMGLAAPRQEGGVSWETGPNAILLSDVAVQNGSFSNLAEFPILQMFYRQGMLVPGHPRNTGAKPLLLGIANQLKAQLAYIELGKRGIMDESVLAGLGLSPAEIAAFLATKREFAFGDTRKVEELLDARAIEREPMELRPGLFLKRAGLNRYEFTRGGESVEIDMNLAPGAAYEPAVKTGFHEMTRGYFSVCHIGEGDGWDRNRPCMGSVLSYQGKIYLIDTGPDILRSLSSIGLSASDIEGVFQTHAHDDHFAGLPALARSDHRIKYYADPLVRASVMKKTCALLSIPESRFGGYFEIHDLVPGEWNDVEGLEAMPIPSYHPVETSIFYFRAYGPGGYRSYGHLADIIGLGKLEAMVAASKGRMEKGAVERARAAYLIEADVKKVDAGGGSIHGDWHDFAGDRSRKIYLSHSSTPFEAAAREIGSEAAFGSCDVLIPATQDYLMQAAARFLAGAFPETPAHERALLLACPLIARNAGELILRRGEGSDTVYLLVSGVVALLDPERGTANLLPAGTFLGERSVLDGSPSVVGYRAASVARLLALPAEAFLRFVTRNYKLGAMRKIQEHSLELKRSPVFGDMIASAITSGIARTIRRFKMRPGDKIASDPSELYLVHKGKLAVYIADAPVELVGPGGIFGEEGILLRASTMSSAVALTDCEAFAVPSQALERVPAIEWKLLETYERRLTAFGAFVS